MVKDPDFLPLKIAAVWTGNLNPQNHLRTSIGADTSIVALGLAEAWASVCGSPENIRAALGWAARSSERNGVAMVARYGFAGAEEWGAGALPQADRNSAQGRHAVTTLDIHVRILAA